MLSKDEEIMVIESINKFKKEIENHGGTSLEVQVVAVDKQYEGVIGVIYKFNVQE